MTTPRLDTLIRQASPLLLLALLLVAAGLCGCGLIGAAMPFAGVKLYFACIPEGTRVDTPFGPSPIETLEAGDPVIGYSGKPVLILQKHAYLESPQTVFLQIAFADGAVVDLCGMHRIAGIRARDIRMGQTVAGRQVTGLESRRGVTRSYDLLTEDAGYRIQGVPVNCMIEEMNAAAARGSAAKIGGSGFPARTWTCRRSGSGAMGRPPARENANAKP